MIYKVINGNTNTCIAKPDTVLGRGEYILYQGMCLNVLKIGCAVRTYSGVYWIETNSLRIHTYIYIYISIYNRLRLITNESIASLVMTVV
jgi:hypothetical protein